MKVEVVDLTDAQARELAYATSRVISMLNKRQSHHGSGRYREKLRTLKTGLEGITQGERDELRLSLGMDAEDREELVQWLEFEKEMLVYADETGAHPRDSNKLNALERGLDKLRDPEREEVDL